MQKRVAAIHDLSGLGRCSLTIALPVLSALGVQCCPVPTAVLSSQTDGYQDYSFTDMTPAMPAIFSHWRRMGERFDGIFTGFLGSELQLSLVERFLREFRAPECMVLVDPVMGDGGRAYDTYTPAMCRDMARLAAAADVITPNLTEAALLLGKSYADAPQDEAGVLSWARSLSETGPRMIAITGITLPGERLGVACFDRTCNEARLIATPRVGRDYPGTGDLFASVLLGVLLSGSTLAGAATDAAAFVGACAARTAAADTPAREGLLFEGLLSRLTDRTKGQTLPPVQKINP